VEARLRRPILRRERDGPAVTDSFGTETCALIPEVRKTSQESEALGKPGGSRGAEMERRGSPSRSWQSM